MEGDDAVEAQSTGIAMVQHPVPTVTLRIEGDGLTIARVIPETLVLPIMRLLLNPAAASGSLQEEPTPGRPTPDGRRTALAEFYRSISPKRYPEKLTVIGAYLQQELGRASFTSDDLKGQFRAVNEPAPANLARDLRTALGNGWMAPEPDDPNQYFVTQSGLDAVESQFTAAAPRRGAAARRARRRRQVPGGAGDELPLLTAGEGEV